MSSISDDQIIRCNVTIRNPFKVQSLSAVGLLHKIAAQSWWGCVGPIWLKLLQLAVGLGLKGTGKASLATAKGPVNVTFAAHHLHFDPLYLTKVDPTDGAETNAVLDRLVGNTDIVVDAGANWGWHAVLLASRPNFAGVIYAYEPDVRKFADLSVLIAQAGLEDKIIAHHGNLAEISQQPKAAVLKINARDQELKVLQGAAQMIDQARPIILMGNWRHFDDAELTQAPLAVLAAKNYSFFYPGWSLNHFSYAMPERRSATGLTLVPFLAAQRFLLPAQINVVCVPAERMSEFRSKF